MVRITGAREHQAHLRRMRSPQMRAGVYQALFAGGNLIQVAAQTSITEGSISGAGHVASAPGEPPNADTRLLDTSIETTGDPGALKVEVSSNAPYSVPLEDGSSKMAARPFMRPASIANRGAVLALVRKALDRANR